MEALLIYMWLSMDSPSPHGGPGGASGDVHSTSLLAGRLTPALTAPMPPLYRPTHTQDGPQCQHGAAECAGNDLINCAQALYPAQALWFPYVRCLARTGARAPVAGSDACAASSGLAASALIECARGDQARRLAAAAREATAALRPRHEGVPWVLVNGVALGDHAELVRSYVCAAVPAGAPRPAACFNPPTSAAARATPGLLRLAWRGVLGRWWAPAAW